MNASACLDAASLLLLGLAGAHGLHRARLLAALGSGTERAAPAPAAGLADRAPSVTVQLPLYNERDVAARVTHACAALDWPRHLFEIQVLDDSDDDTSVAVDQAVNEVRSRGIRVSVLRRAHREGFKAGALAAGLEAASGELVAIFDADFVPRPDFLHRLVPHFQDPGVGMVQARWGHLNAGESVLTRTQATLLDGHFGVDHAARAALGCWFNFNGTAGVWRRRCILDAGGWQGDTLTEDLDLSYRAQLAGWRFVYAGEVVVPGEVPSTVEAFQVQQRRWAMGSMQTFRKLGLRVLRARAPLAVRAEALAHLGANLAWFPAFGLAVLLPWMVLVRSGPIGVWMPVLAGLVCTLPNLWFYTVAGGSLRAAPAAMILALGLVPSQARATLAGLMGAQAPFARTPKHGGAARPSYGQGSASLGILELGLAAPHVLAAFVSAARGDWPPVLFLALFASGLIWVGGRFQRGTLHSSQPERTWFSFSSPSQPPPP